MRVIRKFKYDGIEIRIVDRNEHGYIARRVIAPNGGSIPVTLDYKEPIQGIIKKATNFLNNMKQLGASVEEELTLPIPTAQ